MPLHSPYRWTMLGAIVLGAWYWLAKSKRDPSLLPVYLGALGGAFLGAKLSYLLAEGWRDWSMPDAWLRLATGKSVVGGLLGGYASVELMKRWSGHARPTGDLFAPVIPLGIALGRVGCWMQGCCLGRPVAWTFFGARPAQEFRWPASQVELLFQLAVFAALWLLRADPRCRNRLFFLYLFLYGVFRFFHEFLRDTPKLPWGISVYQLLALLMALLGGWMWRRRGRQAESGPGATLAGSRTAIVSS